MSDSTWKALERKAAGALNGKRNIERGMDYHLSRPDVEHDMLGYVRYRVQVSKEDKLLPEGRNSTGPEGVLNLNIPQQPLTDLHRSLSGSMRL